MITRWTFVLTTFCPVEVTTLLDVTDVATSWEVLEPVFTTGDVVPMVTWSAPVTPCEAATVSVSVRPMLGTVVVWSVVSYTVTVVVAFIVVVVVDSS